MGRYAVAAVAGGDDLKILTGSAGSYTVALARPVVVALLVGLALLASPALLVQYQEPAECANAVDADPTAEQLEGGVPVYQYEALSPAAKRAFDRARAAGHSVTVTGEQCPDEFDYDGDRNRYEIVTADSRYLLTTYANDLIPEVSIAAGALVFLGVSVLGLGLATRGGHGRRFPMGVALVSGTTLVVVTAAVVLDQRLWLATGWTGLVTAGTLVGAGATLPPRRALLLGGAVTVLPAVVAITVAGVSTLLLLPAVLPLLLVGGGIAVRSATAALRR